MSLPRCIKAINLKYELLNHRGIVLLNHRGSEGCSNIAYFSQQPWRNYEKKDASTE